MSFLNRACTVMVAGLVVPLAAAADTIRVPADVTTIQGAIDRAAPGDTVLVAPGSYFENVIINGTDVVLESEGGPDVTAIDGGRRGSVVTVLAGATRATVIRGFTIRNGDHPAGGAGIRIEMSSPWIVGNRVVDNFGCSGVGIYSYFSSPLLERNVISRNASYGWTGCRGGGLYVGGAGAAEVIENEVSDNRVDAGGGGIDLLAVGRLVLAGNRVLRNEVTSGQGGGLAIANASEVEVIQNLIAGNRATQGGGGIQYTVPLGALGPRFVANTVAANEAPNGAALLASGFDAGVEIVDNVLVSPSGPAVLCDATFDSTAPSLRANLVWSSGGPATAGACATLPSGAANVVADPQFVNPAAWDFRLALSSPGIDAGDASATGIPPLDLAGEPRLVDARGTFTPRLDMGAFEFQPPVTPTAIDFGVVQVGHPPPPVRVTVRNDGDAPLTVLSIAPAGYFVAMTGCFGPIPPGGTCPIDITFDPHARGERVARISIGTDRFIWSVTARGTAIAPRALLKPTALEFGRVPAWGVSTPQTVLVTNTGDAPLTVSGLTPWGNFAATSSCAAAIQPLESCAISVVFRPTAGGPVAGKLFVHSDSLEYAEPVLLSGIGTTQLASLDPSGNVSVGHVRVGTTGLARFTLSNAGGDPLTVREVTVSGPFTQTNDCPVALEPGGTCLIWVSFQPMERIAYTGELTVLNDGLQQPKARITGFGGAPVISVSPTSLAFEKTVVGRTAGPQPVTITNTGDVFARSLFVEAQGDFYWGGQCGSMLDVGESCTAWVYFAPTKRGDLTGSLVVSGDSAEPIPAVSLTGRAVGSR